LASLLASAFTTEKLSEQEIENLKNKNELDGMMNELAEYLPNVKTTLIDERDRYLASKIWTCMPVQTKSYNESSEAANKRIVAVIGAGHLHGIKTHLEKLNAGEVSANVSELDEIPKPGFLSKTVKFIIPAIIITLVTLGFVNAGVNTGFSMMLYWVLWNGSLAALGAILALAHPLAILVSFLGAPITTLNPFIGVGIFSGLVQVTFRKPRVSDVQNITEDATSIKGIYSNRITRALLVFFLSSLGSSIGTFVSIPVITGLLVK
jgi:pheromone shutdown-related protein TraB